MEEIVAIQLFEGKKVRVVWDAEKEKYFFSVVDIVQVLTESPRPRKYWSALKAKLKEEGDETSQKLGQLKLLSPDGKKRLTDVADLEEVFRIIQSIPSPKAEPLKRWLAQVGTERLDEIADPEQAIMRGADFYCAKGYSEGWINQRLQSIEMRKELTDEWKARGINQERDYAILTNEMTRAWSGLSIRDYKEMKGLKKENLRDNMTNLELVLNILTSSQNNL